ncbi:igE-binding protein-like [Manis pentadactyla]|uniref:igE-binding protein-like n=1 Tax=Manis pentadactyla TaxID=143292 RepID=UPI00255C5A01|nr:igE-binding protein-like [Manis pentadactyla]
MEEEQSPLVEEALVQLCDKEIQTIEIASIGSSKKVYPSLLTATQRVATDPSGIPFKEWCNEIQGTLKWLTLALGAQQEMGQPHSERRDSPVSKAETAPLERAGFDPVQPISSEHTKEKRVERKTEKGLEQKEKQPVESKEEKPHVLPVNMQKRQRKVTPLEAVLQQAQDQGEDTQEFFAYPVLERPGDNGEVFRQHVPFPFKQLKELKEACNKYGPTAPFTLTILEAMTTEALPAGDWKSLAHACLTGRDYLLWKLADAATCCIGLTQIEKATHSHSLHHQNSHSLHRYFHITREAARQIVKQCSTCPEHFNLPQLGVNPRGLLPNHLWQMDVMHIPEFGKLKYVHVTIDTYSGFLHATALSGESTSQVIRHCLSCFAVMGIPKLIKTDNGSGYTSSRFRTFCAQWGIAHKTGIPYNPQGQALLKEPMAL